MSGSPSFFESHLPQGFHYREAFMTHESRTAYEHHIPPVVDLRYSLTFRTLR